MHEPPGLVIVGRVVKPHGVRGEMRVEAETDFPERLFELREVELVLGARSMPTRMDAIRRSGEGYLVKIAGIDTPEQAEAWRGALLAVPRAAAAALPEGRHFVFDIIGMTVETEDGRPLGAVNEVIRTTANDVYAVRGRRGDLLIPAIASVVLAVDTAHRRIVIRPMPGLLDEPSEGR